MLGLIEYNLRQVATQHVIQDSKGKAFCTQVEEWTRASVCYPLLFPIQCGLAHVKCPMTLRLTHVTVSITIVLGSVGIRTGGSADIPSLDLEASHFWTLKLIFRENRL